MRVDKMEGATVPGVSTGLCAPPCRDGHLVSDGADSTPEASAHSSARTRSERLQGETKTRIGLSTDHSSAFPLMEVHSWFCWTKTGRKLV